MNTFTQKTINEAKKDQDQFAGTFYNIKTKCSNCGKIFYDNYKKNDILALQDSNIICSNCHKNL